MANLWLIFSDVGIAYILIAVMVMIIWMLVNQKALMANTRAAKRGIRRKSGRRSPNEGQSEVTSEEELKEVISAKKSPDSIRSEGMDSSKEDILKKEAGTDEDDDQTYSKMNQDLLKTRRAFVKQEKTQEKEKASPLNVQKPKQLKQESGGSPIHLKTPSETSLPTVEPDFDESPRPPVVAPVPVMTPTPVSKGGQRPVQPITDEQYTLEQV